MIEDKNNRLSKLLIKSKDLMVEDSAQWIGQILPDVPTFID